jgi:hypothetical protein
MVEMLVALVFTSILMAGMAKVFQASLTTYTASGEKISSARRNRMATDLLYDDLNSAGMSLVDITSPLPSGSANPAFYIIPNVPIVYTGTPDPQDPTATDELYMAFDQPLPFEGKLTSGGGSTNTLGTESGSTAGEKVLGASAAVAGTDNSYVIDCTDASYAKSVKVGMSFLVKDNMSHQALQILTTSPSGNSVTVTTTTTPSLSTQVTGRGDSAALASNRRTVGAGVVFILPLQMVRYHIVMLNLDPNATSHPNGIPCLVREQGVFNPNSAFVPDTSLTQVITENVAGFKVYLSADSGQTWAGSAVTATGLSAGWTSGIQAALNTQIASLTASTSTTKNFTDTSNPAWYRNIPVLVRLDLTTRTAGKRLEFGTAAEQAAFQADYKNFTQSLVIVPRHFGLPLN